MNKMMADEKFHNLFPSADQQSVDGVDSNLNNRVPETKECRFCCIGWDSWKTIFIATFVSAFALIGMIVTQYAYHGQIQLQYKQLKDDYESNNTYYEAQLTHKVTGRQVVEGLESLQSSVSYQTRGLRNELNGIEVEERRSKTSDETNCILETSETSDTRKCCALLSQDVTRKTDIQKLEYCISLMLSQRYGINEEPAKLEKSRRLATTCNISNNKRILQTVCCSYREDCPRWKDERVHNMCNVCHSKNRCPPCMHIFFYG